MAGEESEVQRLKKMLDDALNNMRLAKEAGKAADVENLYSEIRELKEKIKELEEKERKAKEGRFEAAARARKGLEAFITGTLIGESIYFLVRTFEMQIFGWGGLFALFLGFIYIIYIYPGGGFPAVVFLSIAVLVFSYLWSPASPYGATVRESVKFITEPLGKIIDMAADGFEDLWLMMTNPNEYIRRKMYGNVEAEKPGYTGLGVEITMADARPSLINNINQEFDVYVRIENKGGQEAKNVNVVASCEEGEQCKTLDGGKYSNTHEDFDGKVIEMPVKSTKTYTFGPFKAKKEYDRAWKEYSSVKVSVYYEYTTRTSLDIEVMNSEEIMRKLAAGENVFYTKTSTADETMPPAALSFNIEQQPVEGGTKDVLIVAVVNKGEGKVDLDGKSVILILPNIVKKDTKYECKNDGVINPAECPPGVSCTINFALSGATAQKIYENPEDTETYVNFLCEFTTEDPVSISNTSLATGEFTFGYIAEEDAKVEIMEDLFKSEMEGDPEMTCTAQGGEVCFNCIYDFMASTESYCCPAGGCENVYCKSDILELITKAAESEWPGSYPDGEDNLCCRIDVRNMDGKISSKELKDALTTVLRTKYDKFDAKFNLWYYLSDKKIDKNDEFIWVNYRTESFFGTGITKIGMIEVCNQNLKGHCNCGFWSPNVRPEVECGASEVTPDKYCRYCCLCEPIGDEKGTVYCAIDEKECEKSCSSAGTSVNFYPGEGCTVNTDCTGLEPYFCCVCELKAGETQGAAFCAKDTADCDQKCISVGTTRYQLKDYERCSVDSQCKGKSPPPSGPVGPECLDTETPLICCQYGEDPSSAIWSETCPSGFTRVDANLCNIRNDCNSWCISDLDMIGGTIRGASPYGSCCCS